MDGMITQKKMWKFQHLTAFPRGFSRVQKRLLRAAIWSLFVGNEAIIQRRFAVGVSPVPRATLFIASLEFYFWKFGVTRTALYQGLFFLLSHIPHIS